MNFSQILQQGSGVVIAVFIFLLLMSCFSWYIIFLKGIRLNREYRTYKNFHTHYANIKDWPRHGDFKELDGSVGELFLEVKNLRPTLLQYSKEEQKEILSMHLIQKLDEIRFRLDHGLTILASIGSAAPFIGLFGTVWGIYHALADIATNGNAGLNIVAGPMGEALIATAIGLFAAIPAVLAYNSFVRLNRLLVQNLRHIAEQITVYAK